MHNKKYCIFILVFLIFVLSMCAFFINSHVYHFYGNNYFPPNAGPIGIILIFFYIGLTLNFGRNSKASKMGLQLLYFFGVMSLIALATNATQLTPFEPIDKHIVTLESFYSVNIASILSWTHNHPILQELLSIIYDSLPYQMCFLPLFILVLGRFDLLSRYYFLLLFTTLIGFTFYYFFPTTAPASIIHSPFFSSDQVATGLKFNQIHEHIIPTTLAGGLIALPSFHVIWALLCVYLIKEWLVPCVFLLTINSLLVISCVLLGWHYPIDIIGAFILLALSRYFMDLCHFTI